MADESGRPARDTAGSPPPFGAGHRVVHLPTGERWTVDDYYPATAYREPYLLLGRSYTTIDNAAHGEVMEAEPGQVRLIVPAGRPPWPPFGMGDFVEDELTGELWTVLDYVPEAEKQGQVVRMARHAPGDYSTVEIAVADPRHLSLVKGWPDRSAYPGDGWSDLIFEGNGWDRRKMYPGHGWADLITDKPCWADPVTSRPEEGGEPGKAEMPDSGSAASKRGKARPGTGRRRSAPPIRRGPASGAPGGRR